MRPRIRILFAILLVVGLAAGATHSAAAALTDPMSSSKPGAIGHRSSTLQVDGEWSPGTVPALEQRSHELYCQLAAEQVALAFESTIEVRIPIEELRRLEETANVEPRMRVGLVQDLGIDLDLNGLTPARLSAKAMAVVAGAARLAPDGGIVWTIPIRSAGASALRLHLSGLDLPQGTQLYVYSAPLSTAGPALAEAFGPYIGRGPSGSGELWTPTITGEMVVLQLRHHGPSTVDDLASTRLTLESVGHMGHTFVLAQAAAADAKSFCSFNAPCVENGECYTSVPAVAGARDAVAMIIFRSGRYYYICSGGLLADTNPGTFVPYFLTAHHCISRKKEASSVEAIFQYRASSCADTSCPPPASSLPRALGSTILSTGRTGDYTLLQLDQPAPAGSFFLGWNATPVAYSNGLPLYRISHPQGGPQAYSEHAVDTSKPTCSSWPRGGWIYSQDVVGATEGGSSGSPVLDGNGDVVGQLSGGCGYNVGDPCDSAQNATVDGAFATYFQSVAGWLSP